jgi:hypothetical protein
VVPGPVCHASSEAFRSSLGNRRTIRRKVVFAASSMLVSQ